MIETSQGEGDTVIAFLLIANFHQSSTYAFNWQTYGDECYFRQVICESSLWTFQELYREELGNVSARLPLGASSPSTSHPLMVISGGGKFYTLGNGGFKAQLPGYRHLLVVNSTMGASFYQLNTEHGRGDANSEIRSSTNVSIYGYKSEGNFVVMWIRQSSNVSLYGYGGNAAAYPLTYHYPPGYAQYTPSLFRLEDSHNVHLVNLMDFIRVTGGSAGSFAGEGVDPYLWSMVLDVTRNFHLPPMDRPVLYSIS